MEGKGRTGYASSLLEALCGADYDDLLSDYIKTYEYYYDMTEEAKPDQRRAVIETSFDPIMEIIFEMKPTEDVKTLDYAEGARRFFRKGGLSDEQIDEMVQVFTGKK